MLQLFKFFAVINSVFQSSHIWGEKLNPSCYFLSCGMRNREDIELIKARLEKQLTRRILVFPEANNMLLVNYGGFDFQDSIRTVTSIVICTSIKVDIVPLTMSTFTSGTLFEDCLYSCTKYVYGCGLSFLNELNRDSNVKILVVSQWIVLKANKICISVKH